MSEPISTPPRYPVWDPNSCGGCGADPEDGELLYILECPGCGYEGCPQCIPGGRGAYCESCLAEGRMG